MRSVFVRFSDTSPERRFRAALAGLALLVGGVPEVVATAEQNADALIAAYVDAWREFYPTRAFARGDAKQAAFFESYADQKLDRWLVRNAATEAAALRLLAGADALPDARVTDLRVLAVQSRREQAQWSEDRPRETQPQWYAEQVSQALTHLLVREQLSVGDRNAALIARLQGVARLCEAARLRLREGNRLRSERALRTLGATRDFYDDGLRRLTNAWPAGAAAATRRRSIDDAISAIAMLEEYLRDRILPGASPRTSMGARRYGAKLQRRSAGAYTPEALLAEAGAEMERTKELMVREARRWSAARNEKPADPDEEDDRLLALALDAMEAERASNQAEFLRSFRELTAAAERFVIESGIATVPQPTTLFTDLSPAHFSGAAVGGVYPSGPFDPTANTLFYLPSIADDAAEQTREGFYRSFNTHFNTMIISHEMFPGHYLQYKVAVSEAPVLRSLFPDGAYVEGWGSFVEELMLDAGWADNAPLTRLAHLRKRLENATRAYVSVQVHTQDWNAEQVLRFAEEEGLLAPQFARNLWQRAVHSPLQITDYMRGYKQFQRLWASRDPTRPTRAWVDSVLRAGPVPVAFLGDEAGL
ncbi:MAG: DUF885 family protein [Pseudomonadota bacterium]